jgi:hypothetical protein
MYHRHRFPIVVNMGNGLEQSLFLRVTQEDWPRQNIIIYVMTIKYPLNNNVTAKGLRKTS